MLFNSYEFIFVFLPITLLIYFGIAKFKSINMAIGFLVLASLVFYSYWDINNLPILLCSIIFNYIMGILIEKTKSKKWLVFSIISNLSMLGYFKYSGFFIVNLNAIFNVDLPVPEIILPLGISFFTFTQTAYLVDVYRNESKGYSFLKYSLFVTVFPHLIAGPILYHKKIIPQFSEKINFIFSYKNMALGIFIFSLGLFKKVVIADRLAPWVNTVFENANSVGFVDAWLGALGYTLQLYFDFSGYSEMAIGLGLMFNLKLPINFNLPYKSTSIIDFWRRWHISLSEFLKYYLYIPMGGNRLGEYKRMRNLFLTMLLGGLWHGAGWTFVIWGALHGLYLMINHFWRKIDYAIPDKLSWFITIIAVVFAWVFFRSDNINDAFNICIAMTGLSSNLNSASIISHSKIIEVFVLFLIVLYENNMDTRIESFKPNYLFLAITIITLLSSLFYFAKVSEFLYFQF